MSSNRSSWYSLAAGIAATLVLLAGCQLPAGLKGPAGPKGSLKITLQNMINARTIGPATLPVAMWTVTGTGPGGASFMASSTGASLTQDNLDPGDWTLVVNALNSTGLLANVDGTGSATAHLDDGATTSVSITVMPVSGTGSLWMEVTWPSSEVQNPSISASLTPALGSPLPLACTISGSVAQCTRSSVGNGYYTLAVSLLDNGVVVAGAVDVARIVTGLTVTGEYTLYPSDPAGTIQVNVTANLQNPLDVSISGGQQSPLTVGTSQTLSASVSNYSGNVVYVWYVNGASQGTGSSFTFGPGLSSGNYRIDATAFTADGTQAGSTTVSEQLQAYYLYSANGNGTISAFAIDPDGTLSPVPGEPFPAGDYSAYGMASGLNGRNLYVTNPSHEGVFEFFDVDAQGALSLVTIRGGSTYQDTIILSPDGKYLYTTDAGNGDVISAYSIGVGGAPVPQGTVGLPNRFFEGLAVSADSAYVYAASGTSGTPIVQFSIGTSGALTQSGTFPWISFQSGAIGITPNGKYLYGANGDTFSIGAGGALSPIGTQAAPGGLITFSRDGQYLYASRGTFSVGADGTLTQLSSTLASYALRGLVISPDGRYLYGSDGSNNVIAAFAIGTGGVLTPLGTFATGAGPAGLAVVTR